MFSYRSINNVHLKYLAVLLFTVKQLVNAELLIVASDLEPLLETHKTVVEELYSYVNERERILSIVQKYLTLFNKEYEKAIEDIQFYLGNPINYIRIINRLSNFSHFIEDATKERKEYERNAMMKYPLLEDLYASARTLAFLQETYDLNVTELSNGILKGKFSHGMEGKTKHVDPMSSSDCYLVGHQMYTQKDHKKAVVWLLEAFYKFIDEDSDANFFTKVKIVEYISKSYRFLDDIKNALIWAKKLLEFQPEAVHVRKKIELYQKRITEEERQKRWSRDKDSQPMRKVLTKLEADNNILQSLCRGEMDIPNTIMKRCKCNYLIDMHPVLKLAPIKMEQVYEKPDIFLFYDALSEAEIEYIKELAKPKLERAKAINYADGKEDSPPEVRICKSAWIGDEESDVIARISRRVSHLTGLITSTAEDLQVAYYGIGGHFSLHQDFAGKNFTKLLWSTGNRIATVLFYMSDVAKGQGGATVFPTLGLSVFPVKRAALFWRNLLPTGEGDTATRHAACPVLRGSKWVANKWIH